MIPDLFHGPVTPVLPVAEAAIDGDGSAFAALLEAATGVSPSPPPPQEVLPEPAHGPGELPSHGDDAVRAVVAAGFAGGLPPHPANASTPATPPPAPGQAPAIRVELSPGAHEPAPPAGTPPASPAEPPDAAPPGPAVPPPVAPLVPHPGRRPDPAAPTEPSAAREPATAPGPAPRPLPTGAAPHRAAATDPGAVSPVPPAQPAPTVTSAAVRPAARPIGGPEPEVPRPEALEAGPAPAAGRAVAPGPAAATAPPAPPPAGGLTERVVRVVEEQARLAPPRSVIVELGGDARLTVALRGTEIHLAWNHPATADLSVLQREVSAALTARGFDLGRGHPDRPPAREPDARPAPRRRPGTSERGRDGLLL